MTDRPLSIAAIIDQFRAAMRATGLGTDARIEADGTLHRFRVDGDKRGACNGWYVLHADGIPAGMFGSWKTGMSSPWRADIGRRLTATEEAAHRARIEAARAARIAEEAERHAAARKRAAKLWASASDRPKTRHPYLVAKAVRAYGLRQLREQLLIPVRDAGGEWHGLQFIDADGSKKFLTGTAKAGHYHAIGRPAKAGEWLAIAEGYATGATVHELTGWPVAIAFDCGNLASVAEALHGKYPEARIVIAADNDHGTEGNPGRAAAIEAAQRSGGIVALPDFETGEQGTDWNDYAAARGVPAACEALFRAIEAGHRRASK